MNSFSFSILIYLCLRLCIFIYSFIHLPIVDVSEVDLGLLQHPRWRALYAYSIIMSYIYLFIEYIYIHIFNYIYLFMFTYIHVQ